MTNNNKLDLTSFQKAVNSLQSVLGINKTDITRDATIQRFEYCYELSWKMMKRHLEWTGSDVKNLYSKRELFREAHKANLISDPNLWFEFNDARNSTSHTRIRRRRNIFGGKALLP